jgi:hypothetical protein
MIIARTIVLVAFIATAARAHQDPAGDTQPTVKVENGNFAIYFTNNLPRSDSNEYDSSGEAPVYRMVYSPTGRLLGPRSLCRGMSSEKLHAEGSMVYNKTIELGDERVLFDAGLLKKSKPSYLVERNGVREHRRLPWPDEVRIDYVASVHVETESLLMSATTPDHLLRLYYFDRNKFEPPASVVIGEPTYIYDFPGASNVILAAGRYWLVWVRWDRNTDKFQSVLSSWAPSEEKPREKILGAPADWNTSLSIAAIGDRLGIAYHCSLSADYPGRGQIITIFTEAK